MMQYDGKAQVLQDKVRQRANFDEPAKWTTADDYVEQRYDCDNTHLDVLNTLEKSRYLYMFYFFSIY